MTDEVVAGISDRYIELYEAFTGQAFVKEDYTEVQERIKRCVEENIFSAKDYHN